MVFAVLGLVGGVVALYFGAHWLVRGAARLGSSLDVSPIVVGLTVVSLGTSAPELAVCVLAALNGSPDLAIGNVMGSNLANIGLILGITAIVQPLPVHGRVVAWEVPLMVLVTILVLPLILDLHLSRSDGALLLVVLVAYIAFVFRTAKKETPEILREFEDFSAAEKHVTQDSTSRNLVLVLFGSGFLILGGRAIVDSATHIAQGMGYSELLMGATVVAIGTSLPELATSVVAALRNEADIAVGNVIGSNIFNLTAVLGSASLIQPMAVSPGVLTSEFPAVVFLTILVLPVAWTALTIQRSEGWLLLAAYAVIWFLVF